MLSFIYKASKKIMQYVTGIISHFLCIQCNISVHTAEFKGFHIYSIYIDHVLLLLFDVKW